MSSPFRIEWKNLDSFQYWISSKKLFLIGILDSSEWKIIIIFKFNTNWILGNIKREIAKYITFKWRKNDFSYLNGHHFTWKFSKKFYYHIFFWSSIQFQFRPNFIVGNTMFWFNRLKFFIIVKWISIWNDYIVRKNMESVKKVSESFFSITSCFFSLRAKRMSIQISSKKNTKTNSIEVRGILHSQNIKIFLLRITS